MNYLLCHTSTLWLFFVEVHKNLEYIRAQQGGCPGHSCGHLWRCTAHWKSYRVVSLFVFSLKHFAKSETRMLGEECALIPATNACTAQISSSCFFFAWILDVMDVIRAPTGALSGELCSCSMDEPPKQLCENTISTPIRMCKVDTHVCDGKTQPGRARIVFRVVDLVVSGGEPDHPSEPLSSGTHHVPLALAKQKFLGKLRSKREDSALRSMLWLRCR